MAKISDRAFMLATHSKASHISEQSRFGIQQHIIPRLGFFEHVSDWSCYEYENNLSGRMLVFGVKNEISREIRTRWRHILIVEGH